MTANAASQPARAPRSVEELKALAARIRGRVVEMSHREKSAHLGSAFSCVDLLTVLYWNVLELDPEQPEHPDRDRLLFSKGHAAMALYATLALRGFFPEAELDNFALPGGGMGEHPIPGGVPGLDAASGSLGHCLGLGIGMALAARLQGRSYRVFVLMSDGECNEGSVWEAAMMAPAHRLDRLVAVVDFNKWQATGRSCEVMALQPLAEKWRAFGWNAVEIDGHDIAAVADALKNVPSPDGKPLALIAHTVKGKGVSFMEDDNNWHYRIPTEDEKNAALRELGLL